MPDPQVVALVLMTVAALLLAGRRFAYRFRPLLDAPASNRTDSMGARIRFALADIGLHRRLRKFRLSGLLHALIFLSFFILLTAILRAYLKVLAPSFTWLDYLAIPQDIGAVTMLLGVGLALYNRLVIKPERFKGSNARDAYFTLSMITAIVVTMELEFAFSILAGHEAMPFHPLAAGVAGLLSPVVTPAAAAVMEAVFYWLHLAIILGFLVYLPGSKHQHMFTGLFNIVLRNREARGRLRRKQKDSPDPIRIVDLARKDMLDLYSCTECGRCQSVCPAYSAGLPLSPKTLIMNLRDELAARHGEDARPLAGTVISEQTLWACTTCSACMEVCPLHIEHVPKIIDMRGDLVDGGEVPTLLQDTLVSFQRYGNSFKKPARARPKWAKELDFEIPDAAEEHVEFLWYVGDYASYHPLVQKQTCNIATLLHNAGVSFGIMYDREKNAGNDLRRIGDEGLYQELAEENIASIKECSFDRIMTTDPHTLNTLQNEYSEFGLDVDVVHYTELFDELMRAGRLEFAPMGEGRRVTFHDPCYLGRYNRRFDAPREVIRRLGFDLREMRRNKENSFCCGAGGGRIFMEDQSTKERPSESRIREALEIDGVCHFVVTCPKDVVMYTAAVENVGAGDLISVVEISELFHPVAVPVERLPQNLKASFTENAA